MRVFSRRFEPRRLIGSHCAREQPGYVCTTTVAEFAPERSSSQHPSLCLSLSLSASVPLCLCASLPLGPLTLSRSLSRPPPRPPMWHRHPPRIVGLTLSRQAEDPQGGSSPSPPAVGASGATTTAVGGTIPPTGPCWRRPSSWRLAGGGRSLRRAGGTTPAWWGTGEWPTAGGTGAPLWRLEGGRGGSRRGTWTFGALGRCVC